MSGEQIEDGGPAFPTESEGQTGNTTWRHEGMTLRDYFAAHAPVGFDETRFVARMAGETGITGELLLATLVELRYAYADAMLKARQS